MIDTSKKANFKFTQNALKETRVLSGTLAQLYDVPAGGGGSNPCRQWRFSQRAVAERVHPAVHGSPGEPRRRRSLPSRLRGQPVPGHRGWLHPVGRGTAAGS